MNQRAPVTSKKLNPAASGDRLSASHSVKYLKGRVAPGQGGADNYACFGSVEGNRYDPRA